MSIRSIVALAAFGIAATGLTAPEKANAALITTDAIVDFDALNTNGTFRPVLSGYAEDNVVTTTTPPVEFFILRTTNNSLTTGSPFVVPAGDDGEFTLTASDDDFGVSLLSFDGADLFDTNGITLSFEGTRFDGTTVVEEVTTDGGQDFVSAGGSPTTYDLSNLANETFESITFTTPGPGIGIDNIRVRLTQAVPEPSTAILVGSTAAAFAIARLRIAVPA